MPTDLVEHHAGTTAYVSNACEPCVFFQRCGGLFDNRPLLSCFDQYCCGDGFCDHVCPYKQSDFSRRMREIGGLRFDDIAALRQCRMILPRYVPMIHHASRRVSTLVTEAVALDPYAVLRMKNGEYRSSVDSGAALRRRFKVAPNCKVVFRGTAIDQYLERYWSYRKSYRAAEQISALDVSLFIGPNFSHFLDVPRTDALYNRKRQLICLTELSAAGISVAPHLSALTPAHWKFWARFLRANNEVRYVAINFQTGYKDAQKGRLAIDCFRQMQNDVGRKLALILIGGGQFIGYASQQALDFTLIDSEPFARSNRRRRFALRGRQRRWDETWTLFRQPIDELLQANVDAYAKWAAEAGA